MSFDRLLSAPLALLALVACRGGGDSGYTVPPQSGQDAIGHWETYTPGDGGAAVAVAPDVASFDPSAPHIVVATWNLHKFSPYGTDEWRLDNVPGKITELGIDVLAVQELMLEPGSGAKSEQAFDALVAALPNHVGVHVSWEPGGSPEDTVVGLVVDNGTAVLEEHRTIFEDDWYAFPRPPLEARVTSLGRSFWLIVVHLKELDASLERRREACRRLAEHIQAQKDRRYVVLGDFEADPYEPPETNTFADTFLDASPAYHIVTYSLPPESVTSTGNHHYVGEQKVTGEFLDHVVTTGELHAELSHVVPEIASRPPSEYADWKKKYSDHFPVLVRLYP